MGAYAPRFDIFTNAVMPPKFDVYCLGEMLIELLTGDTVKKPFMLSDYQKLCQRFDVLCGDLLLGMLH